MIRKLLLSLSLLIAPSVLSVADSGVTVTVTVTNIPGAKGNLLVGLYDSERTFTKKALPVSAKVAVRSKGSMTVRIPNVKPGTYAISVIQDLNKNGRLDRNFVGMPTEPLAFSVIRKIPRGKPRFADCSFAVGTRPKSMRIPLVLE